jgi:hypothetical protein
MIVNGAGFVGIKKVECLFNLLLLLLRELLSLSAFAFLGDELLLCKLLLLLTGVVGTFVVHA